MSLVLMLPVEEIQPSKTNPRQAMDPGALKELQESILRYGVLSPIVVRKIEKGYEVVCGHRRMAAAKNAGLKQIPAAIKTLSDQEAMQIQIVENLQRADLHPMEEMQGFKRLIASGINVAGIAERVGKSFRYVYDRLQLAHLIEPATKLFRDGVISAGHAMILSRLAPQEQKQCIDKDRGGLWCRQELLFGPDGKSKGPDLKPVSALELQAWVDKHIRLDTAELNPVLFADTVAAISEKDEKQEKIIKITYDYQVHPDARDPKERTYGPMSWRRADGKEKSKVCSYSNVGVIVAGYGRGEAFKVCTEKKKCTVHWKEEIKQRTEKTQADASDKTEAEEKWKKQQEQYEKERQERQMEVLRLKAAWPLIVAEVARAVKGVKYQSNGVLAKLLFDHTNNEKYKKAEVEKYVRAGKTAEGLIQQLAFLSILSSREAWSLEKLKEEAMMIGVDVKKIMDSVPESKLKEVKS